MWIINPNNEYLPGGPLKTELTVRQGGATWYIDFTIDAIPTSASAASLVLDVAGSDGVTIDVTLNGSALGTAKASYDDGSIDRDQPHGTLQGGRIAVPLSRLEPGTNRFGITPTGRLMWDYLRLEWVTS